MKLQRLYSLVRQAMDDYHMIQDGDKIAVGVSGGNDSLTLLYALSGLRGFYPARFDLCAITVDLGIKSQDLGQIQALCDSLNVPLYVVKTEIGKMKVSTGHFALKGEKAHCRKRFQNLAFKKLHMLIIWMMQLIHL